MNPDIAVVAPRWATERTTYIPVADIFAVVELADASLRKDLGPKAKLYGRTRIPDYLVVDLTDDVLIRHAYPHDLGYAEITTLGHGDRFSLASFPDVELEATAFLAPR